jgi:hypothetical protein
VLVSHQGQVLRQGTESDAGPPFVDVAGVTQVPGHEPALPSDGLGAILLRLAFVQQHPVGEVGLLHGRGLAAFDGRRQQIQAPALERRVAVGVLREQPRGLRAVVADQGLPRPADVGDQPPQPGQVGRVGRLHGRGVRGDPGRLIGLDPPP